MPSPSQRPARLGLPDLGVGLGLRIPHYPHVFEQKPVCDWFEVISENFMVEGGRPLDNLDRALADYRVVQHGVSLSIGSASPLDWGYLKKLKALTRHTQTPWLSDHLCWSGSDCTNLHDLLPLPYTEEVVRYVAERARIVQDFLELPFALENVSSYLTYTSSRMSEWDFVRAVAEEADVGLLLDVNNIYVSAENHGFEPRTYIEAMPHERVVQIHLAGHTRFERYIIDTHSGPVIDDVWSLYELAIERVGPVSTLIEWDDEIPSFDEVHAEARKAAAIRARVAAGAAQAAPPRAVQSGAA
ncbi:MAG: DUF692 domain-containing protein [Polyangiaceae bacterium]|nr:DUF692 domain-containing protein [Polyangiaceae bacterium]